MHFSSEHITVFLFSIAIMLLFAKVFGELFNLIKQPAIIGEIIAGIILGPTIFGAIFPDSYNYIFNHSEEVNIALNGIITLSVVLLLLISGLEVDLAVVLSHGKKAIYTSFFSLVIPFLIGFLISYYFPNLFGIVVSNSNLTFALFMGAALSISALPVIAKILMDLKIFKSQVGFIIISSAMLNDLAAWLIFSLLLGSIANTSSSVPFSTTITLTLLFIGFSLTIGKKLFNYIIPFLQTKVSYPGGILNFILILGLFSSAFTEFIGIHAIFGAFIIGIAIGDSVHLKEQTHDIVHQFVSNIFGPIFAVSIGLKINFIASFNLPIILIIIFLGYFVKVFGAGIGSYLSGLKKNEALAIGFGMSARGEMGIILSILALQVRIINEEVFVALVIMALVTSITSAPFMKFFLKEKDKSKFDNLIKEKFILFSKATTKEEVIFELASVAAKELNLDKDFIFSQVMKREDLFPTGIANFLALPHAKIEIKEPFIALAITKNGIDFEANDNNLSRIIILLLTPSNKNEIQLELLSKIAKTFENIEFSKKMISAKTQAEILKMISNS